MRVSGGNQAETLRRSIRTVLVGPQLAAFLPAILLGVYWFWGEGVLFTAAVIFPVLVGFVGFMTRVSSRPAGRDWVTDLPGRTQLVNHLDTGLRPGVRADNRAQVCLVIEVDNFERLKDLYGETGIEAIQRSAADRIRAALRSRDFVAALGKGRFGLALLKTPQLDAESMIRLSGRLQEALAAPVSLGNARVLVTTSVGFALPSQVPDQTGEACLAAAESALEDAKRSGAGSIRAFAPAPQPRAGGPAIVASEVGSALDSGRIRPWFQPQISTDTGKLTGFEALARWHHPETGMIAPGAFLPAIARAELFERLGEVILQQSLAALREWDRAGLNVPMVAVNFSPEELRNPKLVERIRGELDRFDLSPGRLTIEILEDMVAQPADDGATRNIAALAQLGCGIDLDDFGIGHASVSNIRRVKVNRIKIDRSFVTHVESDRDQQNMVAAILTMAERLGLDTIGEGVESPGEHAMLAQLGCRHVQGYSIAEPMPFEQTASWIVAHQQNIAAPPQISRRAG